MGAINGVGPDGTLLHEGDTLVQRDLAATLTAIAERGPGGFYQGPTAEKLVKAIDDAGGIMTLDDLKSYQPVIRAPVRGSYRGYEVVSMPLPSSGGIVLLETLNVLEGSGGEGIILSVGGGTSPGMPRENIVAMLEALEEFNNCRALQARESVHG